ncbi:MAG: hypothetical protein NC121_18465 [Blautia sp.]|nr:hypothetical protein [Blautia sp.]
MKNRMRKSLMCGAAVFMLLANTLNVLAADMSKYFDPEYYAEQNPDVVEICGTTEEALYEHYVTYGIREGRNCSEIFNVKLYREHYPDLEEAFGDDWEAYVEHYLTVGVQEGRDGCGAFDAVTYADRYDDLKQAYGYDLEKLYEHYKLCGQIEGREAESFIAYLNRIQEETRVTEKLEGEFGQLLAAYVEEYDKYVNTIKPSWERLYRSEAYQQFTAYMKEFWDRVAAGEISQEDARNITVMMQDAFAKYAEK